MQTALPKKC